MSFRSLFRQLIRQGTCRLALAVLVSCLAGCTGWETRNQGLRPSDLSATARHARAKADSDKAKSPDSDDLLMSDRAKQISRDLQ